LPWIALLFLASLGQRNGDIESAEDYARQSLACARASGDALSEGQSLAVLSIVVCENGEYAAADALAGESLRLARAAGDTLNECSALLGAGLAALGQGALEQARMSLEAGWSMAQQVGEPSFLAANLFDALGDVAIELDQPDQARAWLARSLDVRHEAGERWGVARTVERFGALAARNGQPGLHRPGAAWNR